MGHMAYQENQETIYPQNLFLYAKFLLVLLVAYVSNNTEAGIAQ
jgi:ABC-type uncharacterized transport system permease subunit